ncbi:MAG: VPGUxxT family thioredoxin-like (seleno)protein, type 2 [Saprospiraceae bacterium]
MKFLSIILLFLIPFSNYAQPEELGDVNWNRDYQKALSLSKKENKPVFILFQEVPGCATCRNYGQNVMSHPLIVEAIETCFIPLAIYNNKQGADATVLKKYNEPSWNNPVVRIVNQEGDNLVARIGGNYEQLAVCQAMIAALEKEGIAVPNYLFLLEEELNSREKGLEIAHISMFCFWSGEKNIGDVEGVIETQAGFMNGAEVVQVSFDPRQTSFEYILKEAKTNQCASKVFSDNPEHQQAAKSVLGNSAAGKEGNFRPDREPKYYLGKTVYRYVPMTQLQAARVNSLIAKGKSPYSVLSPRQIDLAEKAKTLNTANWPIAINVDIMEAWNALPKS